MFSNLEVGDWVEATCWTTRMSLEQTTRMSLEQTTRMSLEQVVTIVLETSHPDNKVYVAWLNVGNFSVAYPQHRGWWVSTDSKIVEGSRHKYYGLDWGKINKKLCPNCIPNSLKERYKDVFKNQNG